MNWSKQNVQEKLQALLDECMSSANQEGSLKILDIEFDDETREEGTGKIEFTWCTPEPENNEPYFQGY